jgi:uncharacterized membrane protein
MESVQSFQNHESGLRYGLPPLAEPHSKKNKSTDALKRAFAIGAALGLGAWSLRRLVAAKKFEALPLVSALAGGILFARGSRLESETSLRKGQGFWLEVSKTIDKDPQELYDFWRNFENLPRFMKHLERVEPLPEDSKGDAKNERTRWTAKGPAGTSATWEARIINEHPGELIAWESIPGSWVDTAGSVRFDRAPGNRGTELKVVLKYNPPGRAVGHVLAKLFGDDPKHAIRSDLDRLKAIMECGEAPSTKGQPHGPRLG